jgi:hypothetical protein
VKVFQPVMPDNFIRLAPQELVYDLKAVLEFAGPVHRQPGLQKGEEYDDKQSTTICMVT